MDQQTKHRHPLLALEDWWAVWLGGLLILSVVTQLITDVPVVGRWSTSPADIFNLDELSELALLGGGLLLLTAIAIQTMGASATRQAAGFIPVFILAIIANAIAKQTSIQAVGFGYAFWALIIGLLIANTVGTPKWIQTSLRSELYIKTGLVLLGAEILFSNVLNLGIPGLFVAWIVTPTVIIFMYQFGIRVLRMTNRPLVIVIAAATSVCGVSAAIAAAAASRAKKEDLTLAVGMSLIFTVLMMVIMPFAIRLSGMDTIVGAAWIGGTIDATGAVVAAGALLGEQAEQIAAVVKMIQNTMIGLIAFMIAVYWVTTVETTQRSKTPQAVEIWQRFPKFIIGFVATSLIFSFILMPAFGTEKVEGFLDLTSDFRSWLFCLAFVSIGLSSNFSELRQQTTGGQPIKLYVTGQLFNLALTLLVAYLAFGGILFDRISVTTNNVSTRDTISNNIKTNRDATGLFYTDVPGWKRLIKLETNK
jgi:uncharacterized integral membrane protein (TIGR00698 family)